MLYFIIIINSFLVTYALSWSCALREIICENELWIASNSSFASKERAKDENRACLSENDAQFPLGP